MEGLEFSEAREKSADVTSSVEDAVQELLCMTNAAVKRLTEPPQESLASSESLIEESLPAKEPEVPGAVFPSPQVDLIQYEPGIHFLEMLSESQHSNHIDISGHDLEVGKDSAVAENEGGKVVDVTNVLGELPRSEISILDVGGGQLDTTASSLSTSSSILKEKSYPYNSKISQKPEANIRDTHGGELGMQEEGQRLTISVPRSQPNGQKNFSSSFQSNSSENTSTASEVLKQSTQAPKLPDSARVARSQNTVLDESQAAHKALDKAALDQVQHKQNPVTGIGASTEIIIRKSSHIPRPILERSSADAVVKNIQLSQRVRLPKKSLKEIRSPIEQGTQAPNTCTNIPTSGANWLFPRLTLAQGVQIESEDKENKDVDTRLKIIKGTNDIAKMKLLEARGLRVNQAKRVIPANIIQGETAQRRLVQDDLPAAMMSAMASAAPMLQVKQDLESQVKRLTEKLDELEKQKRMEQANRHQERAANLERKLEELTTQRLKSLEQLQEQQAAWQSHFLKVVGNMQNVQQKLTKATSKKGRFQAPGRSVRFDGVCDSPDALRTPAPRTQAPHPIDSNAKGTSPGNNAYLLKNILDQMNVSTPCLDPAIVGRSNATRDPLAELTPVRGPVEQVEKKNLVSMTSTPQAELGAGPAMMRARKEAEKEAERMEIMRRFPSSLSDYMVQDPGLSGDAVEMVPDKGLLTAKSKAPEDGNSLERFWKDLKDLEKRRKILDENLATVERGRGGKDIAAKINYEILSAHPEADPTLVEKLRIRSMVDQQIKTLKCQMKANGVSGHGKVDRPGAAKRGRLPLARTGAKVDTGLKKKHPFQIREKRTATKASAKPASHARSSSVPPDVETVCPDTEEFVTHVYGRADYHPRRTTVHNPYMHVRTPVKKPTFRKKKAVEVVKASFVKSAKTQTTPPGTDQHPRYYFSPSVSPVRPPISSSPTPGQLIPMAIPLGAPRLSDGPKAIPLLIHQTGPKYTTFTMDTPEPRQRTRVCDSTSRKPNTAVISVRGQDGADLAVQKLENIDIDTPDVSEATGVKTFHPPMKDEIPGSTMQLWHDQDESEGTEGSLHIELRGGAGSEAPIDYHGPSFPPVAPPPERRLNASDIAEGIDKRELEHETARWVEQEILARILSELYPPGAQQIRDSGPVDEDDEESVGERGSTLLNPESLQLFIDAGLPLDEETVSRLVEDELTKILREMIKRPAQDQSTRPKTPIVPPRAPHREQTYVVPTPLPTPEPSPASSVTERPRNHLHTPSLTPESSMAESLPPEPSDSSPVPRPPTPKVESPPKTPEDITLVETPNVTPPCTPTPEPKDLGTPVMSVKSSPPPSPKREYPDPWGNTDFPLPEELYVKPKEISVMTFAPPPDAVDLVVRAVTPPPATPPDRSLSEPDTTETTSSGREEGSISEGQLVISHGEARPKMKRGQLPGIIEEIFGDEDVERSMALQNTLRDAKELQDYEPCSDGEIRLSVRPAMISRVIGHGAVSRRSKRRESPPGDDPAGIYSKPRHPLPSDDEDSELSVGEVKPKTMADRRNRFRKWREERSPKYSGSHSFGFKGKKTAMRPMAVDETVLPDSPLSMDDLHKRENASSDSERSSAVSEMDESLGANVIVVTPAASMKMPEQSRKGKSLAEKPSSQFSPPIRQRPINTIESEDFQKVLASTDHSGIIKDSLEDSMKRKDDVDRFFDDKKGPSSPLKVSLTLPTVEPVASMSSEPISDDDDVSEISTGGL